MENPLDEANSLGGSEVVNPVSVGAWGATVSLEGLSLYRDVYYEAWSEEVVQLGGKEYYLLGDNAAISIDSRRWGGVSKRFLVGKPLGVR